MSAMWVKQCANTYWHRNQQSQPDELYLRRSFRLWNHHGKPIGSTYLRGLPYRWSSFQGMGYYEIISVGNHNLITQQNLFPIARYCMNLHNYWKKDTSFSLLVMVISCQRVCSVPRFTSLSCQLIYLCVLLIFSLSFIQYILTLFWPRGAFEAP